MAAISGLILNSLNQPVNPTTVTARALVASGVGGGLVTPSAQGAVAQSDGSLTLTLPAITGGTAYALRVVVGSANQPNFWDSGEFTVVLFGDETKTWQQVLPTAIPAVRPDLDRSVARVASQITADPNLASQFRASVGFRPVGTYSPSVTYRVGDIVDFQGHSYTPRQSQPIIGIQPPIPPVSNTIWQVIATQGPAGTGQTGDNSAYNQAAWTADTVRPPTKSAVAGLQALNDAQFALRPRLDQPNTFAALQTFGVLETTNQVTFQPIMLPGQPGYNTIPNAGRINDYFAPKVNPEFSGAVLVPDWPTTDDSSKAANTRFVRQYATAYRDSELNAGPINKAIITYSSISFPQSNNNTDTQTESTSGTATLHTNRAQNVGASPSAAPMTWNINNPGLYLVTVTLNLTAVNLAGAPVLYFLLQNRLLPSGAFAGLVASTNQLVTGLQRFTVNETLRSVIVVGPTEQRQMRVSMLSRNAGGTNGAYTGSAVVEVERIRS